MGGIHSPSIEDLVEINFKGFATLHCEDRIWIMTRRSSEDIHAISEQFQYSDRFSEDPLQQSQITETLQIESVKHNAQLIIYTEMTPLFSTTVVCLVKNPAK